MLCPKCMSKYTVKEGTRKRKSGRIQEYSCNACTKWFSTPIESDDSDTPTSMFPEDIECGDILEYKTDAPFRLHCATDIHHGANEHHWKKFEEFIDEVDADNYSLFIAKVVKFKNKGDTKRIFHTKEDNFTTTL